MESWVYLFSKFTPEALLFEALAIFILIAVFAGYWLSKRRKKKEQLIPSSVVESYLGQISLDAQQAHASLIGGEFQIQPGLAPVRHVQMQQGQAADFIAAAASSAALQPSPSALEADPAMQKKISELELKLTQQAKEMETILIQKQNIEQQLATASAARGKETPAMGSSASSDLQKKVQELEEKLAEYSVIEDDLANLKRLQQENAALKAQLGGAPASISPAQNIATESKPAVIEPQPIETAEEPSSISQTLDQNAIDEALAGAPTPAPTAPEPEPIVERVQKSIEETAKAEAKTPAAGATATPAAAAPAAKKAPETASPPSSDEDLIAEFEKMLSS